MRDQDPAAPDILEGAKAIAEFLYGDPTRIRSVYHLFESGQLPAFRLGATVCARKSRLLAWIAEQENAAVQRRRESEAA